MAIPLTLSINEAQNTFIKERGLSPSKILQDSVNKMVRELDPELFQKKILEFTKRDSDSNHVTKWQKLHDFYINEPSKKRFALLLFDYALGLNINNELQTVRLTNAEMHEVQDKLEEFKNEN